MELESIKFNYEKICADIEKAAMKSGRTPEEILFVGVTKTIDTERIGYLVDLGVRHLGENKVQELSAKYPVVKGDVKWHFIGHLQRNKVKYIIDKVCMIHSVDNIKLAEEIDKQAKKHNIIMDVLIQINIAGEKSKFGIKPDALKNFITQIANLSNVAVKGLMTIAPMVENPEDNRLYFAKMRKLLVDNNLKTFNNIDMFFLSMGMTNDYRVAIEEGANIIRIGTGVFGAREYSS